MAKYRVTRHYSSDWGVLRRNTEVDLDADTAAWLLRDAPGIIEPVKPPKPPEPEPEVRAPEKPKATRQVKRAPAKRTDDGE